MVKRMTKESQSPGFPVPMISRIVDLTEGKKGITFLKPFLCIYTNTGAGYSISENPEKFAQKDMQ